MKKLLLISFILTTSLFGYNYNELLIKAQSSIFPKILLLDKKLDEKLIDGKIVYTIACETNDIHTAEKLRNTMNERYQNRLGKYSFEVNIVPFSKLTTQTRTTAVYLLNSDTGIDKVTRLAKTSGYMTFAYDIANLQHGVLLSLMVEKSTVLYLNKEGLQNHNVDFVQSLYQIVRFATN